MSHHNSNLNQNPESIHAKKVTPFSRHVWTKTHRRRIAFIPTFVSYIYSYLPIYLSNCIIVVMSTGIGKFVCVLRCMLAKSKLFCLLACVCVCVCLLVRGSSPGVSLGISLCQILPVRTIAKLDWLVLLALREHPPETCRDRRGTVDTVLGAVPWRLLR